jgi:lipoprotein-releasing system permease protein
MSISGFISARTRNPAKGSFSAIITKIAIGGIALGLFVMLISYAILFGFQENIKAKIFSFGGHLSLSKYDLNQSYQENPIVLNKDFIEKCKKYPGIKDVNVFSYKAGLIKTNDEVQGIVLKGINKDYNPDFFNKNMQSGRFIEFGDSSGSKEVIISSRISKKLKLKIGDGFIVYFLQSPPRVRKLKVTGIYETGMEEFDESFILGDIQLVRRINGWSNSLAGGYEIVVRDFDQLETTSQYVFDNMDYDLGLEKITDKYIAIFDWLNLLDQNVIIFLSLIIIVAAFNMISSLFIMIMERTNMIGVLKALGATNWLIARIFFFNGLSIVFKGLLLGNILGLGFCAIQYYFKLIPLDAENYYMNTVPIFWAWDVFIGLNIMLFFIMSMVLLIPTIAISRISPVRAIKFD